ncbi:MAG: hypothetical protein WC224_02020 [Sphaerochaetaceae bacterium]
MEQQTVTMIKAGAMATILALILYKMAVSSPLFILPLLFFAPRFKPNGWAIVPVGLTLVILVAYSLYGSSELLRTSSALGALLVGLYFPLSSLIGAGTWILFPDKRLLTRLLLSSIFATLAGFALVYWFSLGGPVASGTAQFYQKLVASVTANILPMGLSSEALFLTVVAIVKRAFLPLFMGQFGFCALVSTLLIYRDDSSFQERMSRWQLPQNFVWIFLGSWTIVLFTLLVKIPILEIFGWNVALATTLLYMVQGVSIVAMFIRRKTPRVTATRVFALSFLLAFVPGVNLVVWLALPLLGVVETWIAFRKTS